MSSLAKKNRPGRRSGPTAVAAVTGLKPPPARAPRALTTTADIVKLQRLMTHALVRPLTAASGMQPTWTDGRPMAEFAAEFIKPNDRLTAFDRLELYNRMYWFRLIDAFYDDNPGLRALLGDRKFLALGEAYLAKFPSRSFTLRNLCARLAAFIATEPDRTAPHTALALDVARFEWAQTVAFDGEARPVLAPAVIARAAPATFKVALQPYVTLLQLNHPADDYVLAVKQREALRTAASNAGGATARRRQLKVVARLEIEGRHLSDLAQRHEVLFAARGHPFNHDVLNAARRSFECSLGFARARLSRLHFCGELLCAGDERRLLFFRGCLHLLAELVLFGAQRLELPECGTPGLVGGNREIYRRFIVAASALRALDGLRVVAQELRINHASILATAPP